MKRSPKFFVFCSSLTLFLLNTSLTFAFRAPDPSEINYPQSKLSYSIVDQSDEPSRDETLSFHVPPQITLKGYPRTTGEIENVLLEYLKGMPALLGGKDLSNYKVFYKAEIPANKYRPGMMYIQLKQQIDGLNVEGSYATFAVKFLKDRTVLMSTSIQIYPDIKLEEQKLSLTDDVRNQAAQVLGLDSMKTSPLIKEETAIRYLQGKWRRVYQASFKDSPFRAMIDLTTGENFVEDTRLYAFKRTKSTLTKTSISGLPIRGYVKGRGVIFDPVTTGENLDVLNLSDLAVNVNGINHYTNLSGYFQTYFSGTLPVNARLLGRWADVQNQAGSNLTFSGTANSRTPLNILFNPAGNAEFDTAQVNGYYHTTYIHNWLKQRLPNSFLGIDRSIPTFVNINNTCNAYYSLSLETINFFKAGFNGQSTCINTSYDTVIYHEYGHFIDDMAGGILFFNLQSLGLSEGWGDVIAAYASGQPLIAENFYIPSPSRVRTADNNYLYPTGIIQENEHIIGQAWSGFGWHLRENLIEHYGTQEGIAIAESLIPAVAVANSSSIPGAVYDAILLDDDDGNLENGTPHLLEIEKAAKRHRIPMFHQAVGVYVPVHYRTIQEAIDSDRVRDGHIVYVLPGTYVERIDFRGKNITVKGLSSIPYAATLWGGIYPGDVNPIVIFQNGEGRNAVLDGFTLWHWRHSAIEIDGSSPTIKNCYITGDYWDSPPGFISYGGGILCKNYASPLIINNIILGSGASHGGGIACLNHSSPVIKNVTLVGSHNEAFNEASGAIYASGSSLEISNSIFWLNSNAYNLPGPQIYLVRSTANVRYSNIQDGGWAGEGNISQNPQFIPSRFFEHPTYAHLQPTSPSIDAGDPNDEYGLEPDPNGGRVNQGSFGNTEVADQSITILSPRNNSRGGNNVIMSYVIAQGGTIRIYDNDVNVYTADNGRGTYQYTFNGLSNGLHQLKVELDTGHWTGETAVNYIASGIDW